MVLSPSMVVTLCGSFKTAMVNYILNIRKEIIHPNTTKLKMYFGKCLLMCFYLFDIKQAIVSGGWM